MSRVLRFTLIADGSSDKTLLQITKWLLDCIFPKLPNKGEFADFRGLKNPPKKGDVRNQIRIAKQFFPSDIIFYHRDAESKNNDIIRQRKNEILQYITDWNDNLICIVPVVMMEAWLLIDQEAIKKAAGNRNYNGEIILPPITKLETETNPKTILHDLLKKASGLKGRSLDKFNVHHAVHLVAENITDFSPLRQLQAFQDFEKDVIVAVNNFLKN